MNRHQLLAKESKLIKNRKSKYSIESTNWKNSKEGVDYQETTNTLENMHNKTKRNLNEFSF